MVQDLAGGKDGMQRYSSSRSEPALSFRAPYVTRLNRLQAEEMSREFQGCFVDQFKFFSAVCDAMFSSHDEAFSRGFATTRHL